MGALELAREANSRDRLSGWRSPRLPFLLSFLEIGRSLKKARQGFCFFFNVPLPKANPCVLSARMREPGGGEERSLKIRELQRGGIGSWADEGHHYRRR